MEKARKVIIYARECTKGALKCASNDARHKGKDDRMRHKVAAARHSLLKAPLAIERASTGQTLVFVFWVVCLGTKSYLS